MSKGWHNEYERHALAGMGIKTGQKRKSIYFYEKPSKRMEAKGKYTVYKVPVSNTKDMEMQARVIAKRRKKELAGGLFYSETKPYNFRKDYKVVPVPASTPESKPTAHDKFINDLITYETVGLPEKKEKTFLRKAKKAGIGRGSQGSYQLAYERAGV